MKRIFLVIAIILVAVLGAGLYLGLAEDKGSASQPATNAAQMIERGSYLVRAGDCLACHTVRGGAPFAGGRGIETPFGTIYSSNITPDTATGIGSWTADDFWRAIHNGKGRDGKLLYPAFPYPNYTMVTRADADAMFAYFRTLAPVVQQDREPELRFPFNQRNLLVAWRALYFRPGEFKPEQSRSVEWNRGAYLVQGLGHCNACHTARNILGATETKNDLGGAVIPISNWYAPSLTSESEAGLGSWELQHIADLLRTGVSARGVASGPMAEVVRESLQHLTESDIRAMSTYLRSLPQTPEEDDTHTMVAAKPENQYALKLGAAIYQKHCVECHKPSGAGEPPGFPALAGNRAIQLDTFVNPVRAVLHGGYPPSTEGNPRPYGMPPFGAILNDQEVAAVVSYIRNSWGNHAAMVYPAQVTRLRSVPLE
ncbi:cytochrome c [Noviherbaspirillum cavernae]|uniref:Cytochrome c n=1 Tax=Noviherbaspirillum cavernae TaxID=2320862 RepID=A0A418X0T2_9BURK|nr:cytochrome c [Noviherbaspirillum cavernae]RJG06107.1 cytochrome c [Noviherbaspirillum cavernae]